MDAETKMPSYEEGVKELRSNLGKMLPTEALNTFDQDAQALETNYSNVLKLQPGDQAPDFSLTNAVGKVVVLSELLKQSSVVLTFYRGTWCPYCNLQLNQYQQILPEITSLGAQVVAISPQTPDESLTMQEKNGLRFEVLSDNGNIVARQYTTVFKNGEEPVAVMKQLGIDFNAHYADDSQELPVPAVFIIQPNGQVKWAQTSGGDYRHRVEPADIIQILKNN